MSRLKTSLLRWGARLDRFMNRCLKINSVAKWLLQNTQPYGVRDRNAVDETRASSPSDAKSEADSVLAQYLLYRP